jgi:hypothetical protein
LVAARCGSVLHRCSCATPAQNRAGCGALHLIKQKGTCCANFAKGSRAGSQIKRGANRPYVLARLRRDGRADLIEKVESGALSVRGALAAMTDKQTY